MTITCMHVHRYAAYLRSYLISVFFHPRASELAIAKLTQLPMVTPYCITHTPHTVHSLGRYDSPLWHALIHEIKFHKSAHATRLIAPVLAHAIHLLTAAYTPTTCLVVPIPLTRAKLRSRGYNQVTHVLLAAARHTPAHTYSLCTNGLAHVIHRAEQKTLTRTARAHNVAHAFVVPAPHRGLFHNKHILIVDDVCATGSTVRDAARACLEAGASSVAVVVLCNS